jgi:hypothetical protein
MTNYTTIATLPYPAQSDPPNGPDQFQQLAKAVESRLVNRFKSATERNTKISAPSLGMLSWRDDGKVFEYWNGTAWVGTDQSVAVSSRATAASDTNRAFTTAQSPALVKSTVTLKNPSVLYRMLWVASFDFYMTYSWTAANLRADIRSYIKLGTAGENYRSYQADTTSPTGYTQNSYTYPTRSGFLAPGASIAIASWMTVEKANTVAGTLTAGYYSTDMTVIGVTTV